MGWAASSVKAPVPPAPGGGREARDRRGPAAVAAVLPRACADAVSRRECGGGGRRSRQCVVPKPWHGVGGGTKASLRRVRWGQWLLTWLSRGPRPMSRGHLQITL